MGILGHIVVDQNLMSIRPNGCRPSRNKPWQLQDLCGNCGGLRNCYTIYKVAL